MKIRVIPVIFLKNGRLVQSKNFSFHQVVGNPEVIMDRFCSWNADEVILIDISRNKDISHRQDTKFMLKNSFLDIVSIVSEHSFMPLTVGGGIRSIEDAEKYLEAGADKICLNYLSIFNQNELVKIIKKFGSQFVVVSIDVKKINNKYYVFSEYGKNNTDITITDYVRKITDIGAGEILLNNIDRDGLGNGYDINLLSEVLSKTNLPIIPLGGIGNWDHFLEAIEKVNLSAVAAGNIFNHTENSYYNGISYLNNRSANVRQPKFSKLIFKKNEIL
jgi:cyclase